jgi:hypothetical protein
MTDQSQTKKLVKAALLDVDIFIDHTSNITLRDYQRGVAEAICESVFSGAGRSFVIMFPRQSGKNELQAQLETYLLTINYQMPGAEMVKISPTWKPQTLNAMRRLERVLSANHIAQHLWHKESGYIFRTGHARIYFFSGQPRSNIVGATASVLLEVDEAQDVMIAKYDKDIAPMAASTNATRVFWGTAWTSRTLLSRELRAAREAEKKDGIRRVFVLTADDVAAEVPAYGEFVTAQVARLGRNHPMIKTQYFSEEIDAEGGLFPPERCALMQGKHAPAAAPIEGKIYAAALDLAGEDEAVLADPAAQESGAQELANPKRDSTSLTIFEIDLSSVDDPLINKPSFKVINRYAWIGTKHAKLYGEIKAILDLFDVRFVAVDATGVGAGMCSFLSAALGDKVIPFEFNTRTKSDLLWDFLGIIDSGRFKDYQPADAEFWRQVEFCEFEILEGPQKRVRWGVPDGTRDPATGDLVHDDLLISAAMCAVLDKQKWYVHMPAFIIEAEDPLKEMDKGF